MGQETGMVMKPLANPPSLVARSTGTQSESGLDTLRVTPCTSPLRNSGECAHTSIMYCVSTACVSCVCVYTQKLS